MSASAQPIAGVPERAAAAGSRSWPWIVGAWAAGRLIVAIGLVACKLLPDGPAAHARGVSSGIQLWDGWWYLQVARHWYDPTIAHGETAAFSPGFPVLWRLLMWLPGPPALVAGVVNSLLLLAGLALVHRLTERVLDERRARLTVLVMALFPISFVYSLPYSESLFLLCAAGSMLAIERRRDGAGGILAVLACAVRPTGLALAPALLLARWRSDRRRALVLAALPLLATAAVALGIGLAAHHLTAQAEAQQRGWARGIGFPPLVIWRYLDTNLIHFRHPLRAVADTAFAVLWTVLAVRLWRMRVALEYQAYAIAAVLIPLLGGSALSLGRFGMVAFPFSWALADWADHSRLRLRLTTASLAVGLLAFELVALHASAYVP
jgi:hypothetical protein